jgi:hypothetical protein
MLHRTIVGQYADAEGHWGDHPAEANLRVRPMENSAELKKGRSGACMKFDYNN